MSPKVTLAGVADARRYLGQEVAVSDWMVVDQARIDGFAEVTGDRQWIHVDVERARRESPYGCTVAHGYLTLSLLARFFQECIGVAGARLGINYGFDRVRFMAPVNVDSRLRGRFVLQRIEEFSGGVQLGWMVTIEIEGEPKPACVAEPLIRWYVDGV